MNMPKTMTTFLLGTTLIALQACSGNAATEASDNTVASNKSEYAKPGAAVDFSHNYDGHTKPGETESFQITVRERYQSGMLNISIATSEGLVLSSANHANFSMSYDSDKPIDVRVSAPAAGKYYVNFQAMADDGNGNTAPRAYSVAIYVGDKSDYKKPDQPSKIEETDDGKIIVMDAEETIQ